MCKSAAVMLFFLAADVYASDAASVANERPRRLTITHETVELYQELAPLQQSEQRRRLSRLPPGVRAALWSHNLLTYLREHPELTPEQRRAIQEGLHFLATPDLFAALWDEHPEPIRETVRLQREQAEAIFTRPQIAELFGRLGPEPLESLHFGTTGSAIVLPQQPNTYSPCECGSYFDCKFWFFRDCFHDPGFHCLPTVSNCGWYSNDPCTGFCR